MYEIIKEQAEEEIQKYMLKHSPRDKRNSQKALDVLGHDLSKEKVFNEDERGEIEMWIVRSVVFFVVHEAYCEYIG